MSDTYRGRRRERRKRTTKAHRTRAKWRWNNGGSGDFAPRLRTLNVETER